MDLDPQGFDRLLTTLEGLGLGAAVDEELLTSEHYFALGGVTLILTEARERGWPFSEAWSMAVNRLQPTQAGGNGIDPVQSAELRETRALLEEDRPIWRAAYERREPTTRERAQRLAACWRRVLD